MDWKELLKNGYIGKRIIVYPAMIIGVILTNLIGRWPNSVGEWVVYVIGFVLFFGGIYLDIVLDITTSEMLDEND